MKRLILLILALTLLAGCGNTPVEPTPTTEDPLETAPGIYVPEHTLEVQSSGAVRVFPLDAGCDSIAFMGKTLLTFTCGEDQTVITSYAGRNLTQRGSAQLPLAVLPGDKALEIDQQRIGYYDPTDNCVVFLDSGFQETGRTAMPQNMVGTPVLSENMATAYYCTETEVRAYSLETGISRLIRQQNAQALSVEAALFEDSVLMCGIRNTNGDYYVEFLSSQTGEPYGTDGSLVNLDDWHNQYFLQRLDGLVTEYIFTASDGSQQCFHPKNDFSGIYSLLAMNAVATVTAEETGVRVEVFDLTDGKCAASILLEGVMDVSDLTVDPEQDALWFQTTDAATGDALLCCWHVENSPAADDGVYIAPRYTLNDPDTVGLAACREKADALEERFGVEITFAKEPQASENYALVYEHQPVVIDKALDQLEQAMSVFPEGFLATVAEVSDSGKLHIGLVRDLERKNTGVPDGVAAQQYWVDGNAWLILSVGDTVDQLFYHELAHVLDTFVYSKNVSYDEWSKLNPKGFVYDLSYFQYENHGDSQYLSGKNQAFVDTYSMTFPKEDRARIFDLAITEGNAEMFASKTMQAKLRQFCVGLRNACGWKKDSRSFPWEQYLETSLAYNK